MNLRIFLRRLAAPLLGLSLPLAALPSAAQEDASWPIPGGNLAGFRYSDLDQINADNVERLAVAWTFSLGVLRGQEAAPIVAENTMFVVTAYPNILYALDLTSPGAPVKWKHEPKPLAAAQGVACCDTVNRGAAYADGRVFYNTLDGQTIALDAGTGEELWRARLGDINLGETMTMAPLVVRGKVMVGNSGGEFGVRGWIAALDAEDGSVVWRAYSTGPDRDVLIGERFKPFYAQDRGADLGVASWPPDAWRIGGGTVWGCSPTTPRPICSTTAPPIPARGTRSSGPATTSGPRASSRATRTAARRSGPISGAHTICTTTMASTRTS